MFTALLYTIRQRTETEYEVVLYTYRGTFPLQETYVKTALHMHHLACEGQTYTCKRRKKKFLSWNFEFLL